MVDFRVLIDQEHVPWEPPGFAGGQLSYVTTYDSYVIVFFPFLVHKYNKFVNLIFLKLIRSENLIFWGRQETFFPSLRILNFVIYINNLKLFFVPFF